MKFVKNLLSRIVISIIMNLLNPVITVIVSRIKTGEWFEWLSSPYFIISTSLLIVWLIASLIYRRVVVMKRRNDRFFTSFQSPTYGWEKIAKVPFRDVIWIIQNPIYSIRSYGERNINIDSLEALTPARCPKCETELEEKVNFFGRYKWTCIKCGFNKTNKESMSVESERAVRLVKREFEKERENISS
ncbi:hypothetical protein ACIQXV_15140 [Neobacillus sp. NPDC097160]|uniref:hypothetical protein n=1 Tax=Neobacillus sp. NPDC097160 TaxID=3364298 RepID=UPI00380EF5E8